MSIKRMTHANGTQTPDKIIVDYAINDRLGNQIDTTYARINDIPEDEIFPVYVTLTSTEAGTSDKTAAQINAAVINHKLPVVYTSFAQMSMRAFLSTSSADLAVFCYTDYGAQGAEAAEMSISNTGQVTVLWKDLAPKNSPTFTGTPAGPTAATGTDTTQLATTAFVQQELGTLATVATSGSYTDLINTPDSQIFLFSATYDLGNDTWSNKTATYSDISTAANAGRWPMLQLTLATNGAPVYNMLCPLTAVGLIGNYPVFACSMSAINDGPGIYTILIYTNGSTETWQYAGWAMGDTAIGDIDQPIYWDGYNFSPTSLADVAASGSYNDLIDTPTIPSAVSDLDNDLDFVSSQDLATVATTGSYNDLSDQPSIPDAPGTLDTTATTAQATSSNEDLSGNITLHKIAKTGTYSDLIGIPNLATVATTGSYNDLIDKPIAPEIAYPVTDVKLDNISVMNGTIATLSSQDYNLISTSSPTINSISYLENVTYTSASASGSDTFLKNINGGNGSMYGTRTTSGSGSSARRTLSISHTHTPASDGSTATAITGISSGTLTKSISYLRAEDCSILEFELTSQELTQVMYLTQSSANSVTIDWGDGSALESSSDLKMTLSHTYSDAGIYEVKVACKEGETWQPGIQISNYTYYSLLGPVNSSYSTIKKAVLKGNAGLINYSFYRCSGLTDVILLIDTTSIPYSAFSNCTNLKNIILPPITSIQMFAFSSCTAIEQISLPEALTSVAEGALDLWSPGVKIYITDFIKWLNINWYTADTKPIGYDLYLNGNQVTSVTIPSSISEIKQGVFQGQRNLIEINIPSTVTKIGSRAFSYCDGLTHVTVPSTVTTFGYGIFERCNNLTEVELPSTMNTIPNCLCYYCTRLTHIDIPTSVTKLDGNTFGYSGLTSITLPNSITQTQGYEFTRCQALESADLGTGITSLSTNFFYNCTSLTTLILRSSTIVSVGTYAMDGVPSTCNIYVPSNLVSSYKSNSAWSSRAAYIQAITT